MGRVTDLFIGVAAITTGLFGIGSGSLIHLQFSGAPLGLALAGASAVGGVVGFAKLARARGRSASSSTGTRTGRSPNRL